MYRTTHLTLKRNRNNEKYNLKQFSRHQLREISRGEKNLRQSRVNCDDVRSLSATGRTPRIRKVRCRRRFTRQVNKYIFPKVAARNSWINGTFLLIRSAGKREHETAKRRKRRSLYNWFPWECLGYVGKEIGKGCLKMHLARILGKKGSSRCGVKSSHFESRGILNNTVTFIIGPFYSGCTNLFNNGVCY